LNYLATINTGNFMCENVRESFQAAAKRWGAEYVEITEPFASGTHPFEMKLELPLYPWQPGYRVFFAEGDVLIRDDCPSPFDEVPVGMFAAAHNDQGELDGVATNRQRIAWNAISDCLSQEMGHPPVPYRGMYWNTGVFMFEAAHAGPFAAASELYKILKPYGADDQTILSMMIQTHLTQVHVLDRRWNCVGPIVWQAAPRMPTWITHYAKYLRFRDGRDEVLKSIQWLTDPQPLTDRTDLGTVTLCLPDRVEA